MSRLRLTRRVAIAEATNLTMADDMMRSGGVIDLAEYRVLRPRMAANVTQSEAADKAVGLFGVAIQAAGEHDARYAEAKWREYVAARDELPETA